MLNQSKHSKYANYFGKAGHLLVMSELLLRGWNVAMPEVDLGDDIFVVHDAAGDLIKVQVKSARIKMLAQKQTAQYQIATKQLNESIRPKLVYIFLARAENKWLDFVVISRERLAACYEEMNTKKKTAPVDISKKDTLLFDYRADGSVFCRGVNLSDFKNNFDKDFPHLFPEAIN
jgi:hypothetical protein